MQSVDFTDLIAWVLIIIGCVIILSGIASMFRSPDIEVEQRTESKGIILLGPIPIVWGYGKKTWIIAAMVAITLFLIVIIGFP